MKTMILKELKWNLKWALAGCGVYAFCLGMAIYPWAYYRGRIAIYTDLLTPPIQAVTFVGFPVFGLLLGFLQIFFESRRDSWAFLVHRPLSRSRIFWSKVIAGLLLYFAAILIPSALFLLWFLQPGGLPIPFEWGILLPALTDMMTGVVYYFAGLLVGLRQARWHGSRLWPILAAALVSFHLLVLSMLWPLIFAIPIALVLAAYGAFMTGGAFSRQPRTCKWGLALCLTVAGSVIFGVCWLFLASTVSEVILFLERRSSLPKRQELVVTRNPVKPRSSEMKVTKDGRVVTVVCEDNRSPKSLRGIVAILDQSGKPMEEFKNYIGKEPHYFEAETIILVNLGFERWRNKPRHYGYREAQAFFEPMLQAEGAIHWFFYPRQGRFFGYSRTGQYDAPYYTPLGSAGPDGFQPPSAKSHFRFPAPLLLGQQMTPFYRSESEIYWVDFQSSQVQHVFSAPKGESIVRSGDHPASLWHYLSAREEIVTPVEPEKQKDIYLLTSGNHLVFINRDKGVLADINLPGTLAPADIAGVGRLLGKGLYFVQTKEKIIAISEDGQIQAQYKLPKAPVSSELRYADIMYGNLVPENTWETALYCWKRATVPISTPPFLLLARNVLTYTQYHDIPSPPSPFPFPRRGFLVQTWYELGPGLAGALLALLFCNRRLRKYPFSRGEKITWRLLMLLIGPGALFALYSLYDWPAKEPCPACGKMRVVNREHCEYCGAPFTPPAPTGKEIFKKDEV